MLRIEAFGEHQSAVGTARRAEKAVTQVRGGNDWDWPHDVGHG
jgi:hypothetical protein